MEKTKIDMTPKQFVDELDRFIIGQKRAKKLVAIALRNRIRRGRLSDDIRDEVAPKNIIMIGPTGVGKTEIARRLSKIVGAPFIKVEATKFTEVGYVGRDVESMVRDLMSMALSMVKTEMQAEVEGAAILAAEESLLDILLPPPSRPKEANINDPISPQEETNKYARERFKKRLNNGELEDTVVEVPSSKNISSSIEIFSNNNFEEMDLNLGSALTNILNGGRSSKKRKMTIKQAREFLINENKEKLIDNDKALDIARDRVQNNGIIFIDEIDKIAVRSGRSGGQDISREGVQRDILPIVEGSKVNTKYGVIDTSHILFIAAGAFNLSKPSDLIPELQGRFPLRVELEALDQEALEMILTTPQNSLTKQYIELLKTEEVFLEFDPAAIKRMAEIAVEVNSTTENIGARRLHTIMETLLEEVSFNATEMSGETVKIDLEYVDKRLEDIVEDQDLSKYIL